MPACLSSYYLIQHVPLSTNTTRPSERQENTQSEGKQASEPDPDMTQLDGPGREFKISTINNKGLK